MIEKYLTEIKEEPAVTEATGRIWEGCVLGYTGLPLKVRYWLEPQKRNCSPLGNFQPSQELVWDSEFIHEDKSRIEIRTYFYLKGKFTQVSAVTGRGLGEYWNSIESSSPHTWVLQQNEPIISVLEKKVGRTLIERPKKEGEGK
jgi:hypothetical protein